MSIVRNATSLSSTSLVQTTASSSSVQSASTTTVSYPPIQWITVEKVKPVNYYLTLLESNGTQPYVELAAELQKLPELQPYPQFANATAVAKIAYIHNSDQGDSVRVMNADGSGQARVASYDDLYDTDWQPIASSQRTSTQGVPSTGVVTESAMGTNNVGWPLAPTMSLLIVLVVTICPIAFFLGRRSRRLAPAARGHTCVICGCPLPAEATFCDSCGTKQPRMVEHR